MEEPTHRLRHQAPKVDLDAGMEIGELTLVAPTTDYRQVPSWQCVCRCGRDAVRTAAQLRTAVHRGRCPMCHECLRELRSGALYLRRTERERAYVDHFGARRLLYGLSYDEREQARIASKVVEAGIPLGERRLLPDDAAPEAAWPYSDDARVLSPDWSDYYPMRLPKPAPCDLCDRKRDLGFGCVGCLSFMCAECVRSGAHCECTTSGDGMVLRVVGALLDPDKEPISRERVRQIETRGLLHLRSRAVELGFYLSDELAALEQRRVSAAGRLAALLPVEATWAPELLDKHLELVLSFLAAYEEVSAKRQKYAAFALGVAPDATVAKHAMERLIATQHEEADRRHAARVQKLEEEARQRECARLAAAKSDAEAAAIAAWSAYSRHRTWLDNGGRAASKVLAQHFDVLCVVCVHKASITVRVKQKLELHLMVLTKPEVDLVRTTYRSPRFYRVRSGDRVHVQLDEAPYYICVGNPHRRAAEVSTEIDSYVLHPTPHAAPKGIREATTIA